MKGDNLKKSSPNISFYGDNYIDHIREQIHAYMDKNAMSVRKFADLCDISVSTLNSLLYGTQNDCKLSTAISVAKTLGVSLEELANAETIEPVVLQNIIACRQIPERSKMLVRFVINEEVGKTKNDILHNREGLPIMCPEISNEGMLKTNYSYKRMDISVLHPDLASKIFLGIHVNTDIYMPFYTPYDILLLANDRRAVASEHVVITVNGNLFLAKQKYENGHYNYYGLRDGVFRCEESKITSVVGYVVDIVQAHQIKEIIE